VAKFVQMNIDLLATTLVMNKIFH